VVGPFLAGIRVIGGPLPLVLGILAALAALVLVLRPLPRARRLPWAAAVVVALSMGAGLGLLVCWLVGDVINAFDVSLSPTSRAWVAIAFAGVALATVSLFRSRARRRVAAIAGAVIFVLLGAVGVNADFGQYPTVASILGISSLPDLPVEDLAAQRASIGSAAATPDWRSPAGVPSKGVVGGVTIAATVSHFAARQALVYLPPAALVANPPALPVLVMLSGQPGSPENVFISGHLDAVLDGIAAQHHGLAPIVVVPDQLSAPEKNPMCVDSAIGNSATYLTVDVPAWIRANLDVQSGSSAWGIGGFSQGGTCAIQLGAGHPDLFGSIVDISGELEPKVGTPEVTIAKGFAGDAAAYAAAKPLSIIARHAPFPDTVAIFAVGELDAKYTPWIATVATAGKSAGMHTTVLTSPGTAHDWHTVKYALENGMTVLYARWGLSR
jgi:enterochelin esterase-like enzyme